MTLVVPDTTGHDTASLSRRNRLRAFAAATLHESVDPRRRRQRELRQERTPGIVRKWAGRLSSWIQVREIAGPPSEHELAGLHRGEWEAIQLAKEIKANLLRIDELPGVRAAREQGFTVMGPLGVLVVAARPDLISI